MSAKCPHCGKLVAIVPAEPVDEIAPRLKAYRLPAQKWRGANMNEPQMLKLLRRLSSEAPFEIVGHGYSDCDSLIVQLLWDVPGGEMEWFEEQAIEIEEVEMD